MESYDEPKPFGYWNRRHIAADPRCHYKDANSLTAAMSNPEHGAPKLEPITRMYGMYFYLEKDVDRWFAAVEKWRAEEPERRARRKASEDERVEARVRAEMARMRAQQEVLQTFQQAAAEHEADRVDWLQRQGGM